MSCTTFARIFALSLLIVSGLTFAQSKKELKEENARLQEQIGVLNRQNSELDKKNQELQRDNDDLAGKNKALTDEVALLRQELSSKDKAYQLLNNNYSTLQTQVTELEKVKQETETKAAATAAARPSANDKRKCAQMQDKLAPNATYTETYTKLNSSGWGLQVYSYSNLCMAAEKAEEFKKTYKMYRTYIRVKEANGKRTFAVVYGSLRDYEQAKTYCENFRKIAKDAEGQGAFLVQH